MTAKTMAAVLAEHQDWTYQKNLGYYRSEYLCGCGETFWSGDHEEDPSFNQATAAHQAAALSAAGFGLVAEFSSRQMQLAALMAYDAVEDGALREAGAKALEDAADEWSDWDALQAPEDWLRARATAVRGEG